MPNIFKTRAPRRTRASARLLFWACAALFALPAPARPQSFIQDYDFYIPRDMFNSRAQNKFGIMDDHFQGILFPEVYKNLTSTRVNYPGLWSAERNNAAFGVLPDQLTKSGWSGVYGWADLDITPSTAGFWLGNFDYESSDIDVYEKHYWQHSLQTKLFSAGGAFWGTPPNDNVLKGISVIFDIDNVYAFDGNPSNAHLDRKRFFVNVTALIKISENYSLRAGFHTFNTLEEDPLGTRIDNNRLYTDGFFIGLLDRRLRTLDFWAENSFAVNHADEKHDTVSLGMKYSQGWALSYVKHTLFLGFKAGAGAYFLSDISDEAGSFQYMYYLNNLTNDRRSVLVNAQMPVILDLSIYGSIRCMLSAVPEITFKHINTEAQQHLFDLRISVPEISVRGVVGEKFDFVVKPTLENNIFIEALEIRYRF